MNSLEELNIKIDATKEILDVMPKNNLKNLKSYLKKLNELKEEFTGYNKLLIEEIDNRYSLVENIKSNVQILKMDEEIKEKEKILDLLNPIESPYEKMELDVCIQNLSYYYKKNLEVVNESILQLINKFKEVGIELKENDFNYSNFVRDYFKVFFEEIKNNDIHSKKINEKFEEIYWKCPDIITHIELNFRNLYLKNEKKIENYYDKQKSTYLKKVTRENLEEQYLSQKREIIDCIKKDKSKIIKEILKGKVSIKDYYKKNIEGLYTKFVSKDSYSKMTDKEKNELDENIIKLLNSIYEYKFYLKYKFIIDDIKNIYNEKAKYKGVYGKLRKDIEKNEKKILAFNKKCESKGAFGKKNSNEKALADQNAIILETKEKYKELEQNRVFEKIVETLTPNSNLKDILDLASSFYKYLYTCFKNENDGIEEEEIVKNINELRNFTKWPYFTMLNNITITDENKDLLVIIKDRYQLLNINVTKEDLEPGAIEGLMLTVQKIENYHYMKSNKIVPEEMSNVCEYKKILQK